MNITLKENKDTIKYIYSIKQNNLNVIKNCADLYGKKLYNQALRIIKKNIPTIPPVLIDKLKNIQKIKDKNICVSRYIQTEDIITTDILSLKRNIKTLNIKIKSSRDGSEDMFGYIMLDLFNNRQATYILDKDNKITSIKLGKFVDNKFNKFLELNGEELKSYQNDNISELLCS